MTDSVDRLATPKRASDWLNLVPRTESDGPTNEARTQVEMDRSPNVSRAGGQDYFTDERPKCESVPHVYVVYWPEFGILKAGLSETARWEWWRRRGAVEIALTECCCTNEARRLERLLLRSFARFGAPAFGSEEEARFTLGKRKGGYSECFRLVQSPRMGEPPESEEDYERAYGLILPTETRELIDGLKFDWQQITRSWQTWAAS